MTKRPGRKGAGQRAGKAWLDQALEADAEGFQKLIDRVRVRMLSERQARALRPKFTSGEGEAATVDTDAMTDVMIVACCFDGTAPCIPEGREGEVADLPAGIYQTLARRALETNGFMGTGSGN